MEKNHISVRFYVSFMKSNLISFIQLLKNGYTVNIEEKFLKVYNGKRELILKDHCQEKLSNLESM